jgi:hypothetical protein
VGRGERAVEAVSSITGKVIKDMIRPTDTRPIWRTLLALLALALALAGVVLLALSSGPVDAATTFIVNKTGDAGDRNITDTVCDASGKSGNQCTLRAAIDEANNTPGADTIDFDIGGRATVKTINVGSSGLGALPNITDTVTINGYTQRRAKENTLAEGNDARLKVQLNGANAVQPGGANGLEIRASNSTIKGLVINRFSAHGVMIRGSGATGNQVLGNFIGTNAKGTADRGNTANGVNIASAPDNTIGSTEPGAGNGIFNNGDDGVEISGSGVTGNSVLSNVIFSNGGTTATTNLGIDLGTSGVTNNDTDDPDTGANNLQNFPVITSAIKSSSNPFLTTISGTLNSNPSQSFTIQCFVAVPDPSATAKARSRWDRILSRPTPAGTPTGPTASPASAPFRKLGKL